MHSPHPHSEDRLSKLNGPWSTIWNSSPILAKLHSNLKDLPVAKQFPDILRTALTHDVTIISGDMGTGKTIFVGPALAALDFRVLCTEPRRLAAQSPTRYLSRLLDVPENTFVGVRTGADKAPNEHCPLLFCTDGLALVRAILQHGRKRDFLIIDEAHELNLNMELLLAWTRIQKKEGLKTRLILMSGTMDAERMGTYYRAAGLTVGQVDVRGQRFPLSLQPPQQTLTEDVRSLIGKASGVLIFVPGVRQIHELRRTLEGAKLDVEIFPLHGNLTPEQQQEALQVSSKFKVVISTNLAESSITVPGISAVIDYGTKNQMRSVNGVETLETISVSAAERDQRWARSCREREGIVIDRSIKTDLPLVPFPIPEITRIDLSRAYLQFARIGIAMEDLTFLNNPAPGAIELSKKKLLDLRLIAEGPVATELGKRVLELPVKVEFGIMLEEAKRLGVLDQMISGVAIMHAGGILQRKGTIPVTKARSVLMAELEAFNSVLNTSPAPEVLAERQMLEGNLLIARQCRLELCKRLGVPFNQSSAVDEESILRCVTAGFVRNVFTQAKTGSKFIGSSGESWSMSGSFALQGQTLIVGEPLILSTPQAGPDSISMLVKFSSATQLSWLLQYAPHLFSERLAEELTFSPAQDCVGRRTTFRYGHVELSDGTVTESDHEPLLRTEAFARWLSKETLKLVTNPKRAGPIPSSILPELEKNAATVKYFRALDTQAGTAHFPFCNESELTTWYNEALAGSDCIRALRSLDALRLPAPTEELIKNIESQNPAFWDVGGWRLRVVYQRDKAPLLRLDPGIVSSGVIWRLTDQEVTLPTGRVCNLSIMRGETCFSAPSVAEARRLLCKLLQQELLLLATNEELDPNRRLSPLETRVVPTQIEVREGDPSIPQEFRPRVYGSWLYRRKSDDSPVSLTFEWYHREDSAMAQLVRASNFLTKLWAPVSPPRPKAITQVRASSHGISLFDHEQMAIQVLSPFAVKNCTFRGDSKKRLVIAIRPTELPPTDDDIARLSAMAGLRVQIRAEDREVQKSQIFVGPKKRRTSKEEAISQARELESFIPAQLRHSACLATGVGIVIEFQKGAMGEKELNTVGQVLAERVTLPVILREDLLDPEHTSMVLTPIREHCIRFGYPAADVGLSRRCISVTIPIDATDGPSLDQLQSELASLTDKPVVVSIDRRVIRVHYLLLQELGDMPVLGVRYDSQPSSLTVYLEGKATQRHLDFNSEITARFGVRTQFVENCQPPPPFDYVSSVTYSGDYLKRGEALERLLELQRRLPSVFGAPHITEIHADGLEVFMMQDHAPDPSTMAKLDALCSALPFPVRVRYSNGRQNFFDERPRAARHE